LRFLYDYETYVPRYGKKIDKEVSESKVMRRIFRFKREYVTGGEKKLHNKELHNLHSSPDIIRMSRSRG
jgi:hypothetical protein